MDPKPLLLAALFLLAFVPAPSSASACSPEPGLWPHDVMVFAHDEVSIRETTTRTSPSPDPSARFYVDVREVVGEQFLFSVWMYQESNGILTGTYDDDAIAEGLQPGGGSIWMDAAVVDPCYSIIHPPDAVIL